MAKRVYFAFHYQDVIDFRANVVRNHNAIDGADKRGYFDASIWEESKRSGVLSLKRLINGGLDGTSVTAVLIGSHTYARRWVRYEIMKSVERGNSLIGIHINGIAGSDRQTKPLGVNPFDYLGLQLSADRRTARPTEWDGQKFVWYGDLTPFAPRWSGMKAGVHYQLSRVYRHYDWIADTRTSQDGSLE
jgi:hypothetical protein